MSNLISDLFSKIQVDPWRKDVGFSEEIEEANKNLNDVGNNEGEIITILNKWLQKYQPCLFGRLAARLNLLSFCILTEEDMVGDDQGIHDKIQSARTRWTKEGFDGKKSGFILFVKSPTLANSVPNEKLMFLAKQLCSYYLQETIEEDFIYTDEIWLEKPGPDGVIWKWLAGVNYFCANGDGRWWQDHRFPGGMAFSVNSVGHMAKAGGIATVMNELNRMLDIPDEKFSQSKVDSLSQALEFAMRTIDLASDSISGKATTLIPISKTELLQNPCPIQLPKQLVDKDHRCYKGHYHTDITIPSEYFTSAIERPEDCKNHTLDFTYLYDQTLSNPDYVKMGKGRRVRSHKKLAKPSKSNKSKIKSSMAYPIEEKITSDSRLYKAVNG